MQNSVNLSYKQQKAIWKVIQAGYTLGGILRYKRDRGRGGGGVRRIFLGLKFSTPVFFGLKI